MSVIENNDLLAGEVKYSVDTGSISDAGLFNEGAADRDWLRWDMLIDQYLLKWHNNPSDLEDDDFVPPSLEIIHMAIQNARLWRNAGCPAPIRVVPDGEGGICFEHRSENTFSTLKILEDRSIWLLTFKDYKLTDRIQIL